MASVNLRRVSAAEPQGVRSIRPAPDQTHLVASVEKSLAEVGADEALTAFAAYDGSQRGLAQPERPPVGFAVIEVTAGVGFILRVLVDADHQRRGYGRTLMRELMRRLSLSPDVELIATSHRHDNAAMAALCAELGFEPWSTPFAPAEGDIYLCLPAGAGD